MSSCLSLFAVCDSAHDPLLAVDNRNHPYKTTDAKNDEKEHVCKRDFGPDAPNQDASHSESSLDRCAIHLLTRYSIFLAESRSDGSFEYSNYDKSKCLYGLLVFLPPGQRGLTLPPHRHQRWQGNGDIHARWQGPLHANHSARTGRLAAQNWVDA